MPKEIKTTLKSLNSIEAPGIDKTPIKIAKLNSPLLLPNNPKLASLVPTENKTYDKYVTYNFRPGSILNCFSKVFENVIKKELAISRNNHLSTFISFYTFISILYFYTFISTSISAYRKKYNTLHVLSRLLKEWR